MIKIKDIIKEHKIIMTEAFKSGKLRALANNWRGLDSSFFSYGAKLGIEWDKITDKEIETNTKPKKKGIEIAYVDKDVSVPMKGRQPDYYRGSNMRIDKFTAISVLKDGKPLWYTKSWKPLTNVMTATGKKVSGGRYGSDRSSVPDVDAGSRSYSRDRQFGLNMIGYQSLSGMMTIPGVKFHHINLDEDQPYMGAGIKRQMRQAAQFGAAKFTTNELGGKKASGKVKSFIDKYQSGRTAKTGESEAYQLTAEVGRQLSRLYEYYGYYLGSLQKEKEDKIKYGTTDFSRYDTEGYAKDVQNQYNTIMQMKFR